MLNVECLRVYARQCFGKLAGLIIFLFSLCPSDAQKNPSPEAEAKANCLFNFARFAEWSQGKLPADNSPLVIGVMGEDPFGSVIDRTLKDKKVRGHPVVIRRMTASGDVASCHVLYIARSERTRVGPVLREAREHHVLTVSEMEKFAETGGIISFITVNDVVRFEINMATAEKSGINLSSKLLKVARALKTDSGKEVR